MNPKTYRNANARRRGAMLGMVAVMLVGMAALAVGLLEVLRASSSLQRRDREHAHARYIAQAGLSNALLELQLGHGAQLGTAEDPLVFDHSRYYVERENVSADVIRLTATGLDDRTTARQELVVRQLPQTIWRFGAFGREFVHMNSNARVDSYDSTLGSYASQATNGSGGAQHARTEGDVGSNGDITLEQNARVWGEATPGPSHQDTVLGNATVSGSTAPAPQLIELPVITVPNFPSFGSLTVNSNSSLPSGDRTYSNLTVGGNRTLTITGPANIVVSNLTLRSGSHIDVDASAGPVTFWVLDNFVMNSNTRMAATNLDTRSLHLNLLSDNVINPELDVQLDVVDFASNSKFYGTILAPNAAIVLRSNFELFGSMLARSIDLRSNAFFHFDEALLGENGHLASFETLSWREVPVADR